MIDPCCLTSAGQFLLIDLPVPLSIIVRNYGRLCNERFLSHILLQAQKVDKLRRNVVELSVLQPIFLKRHPSAPLESLGLRPKTFCAGHSIYQLGRAVNKGYTICGGERGTDIRNYAPPQPTPRKRRCCATICASIFRINFRQSWNGFGPPNDGRCIDSDL